MAFKVFYAWQRDQPNNLCRDLIRRALDKAAKELNAELEVEDAVRVEIDQDTQGVAGSPSIAETILEKIRTCDAFVADLTFISGLEGTRATPNPNVLIEYGYALHALGDQRIIGVFNEAFGSPDHLPFDLRHKRWPIRYQAGDDGDTDEAKELRRSARTNLAKSLVEAIGTIIRIHAEAEEASAVSEQPAGPAIALPPEEPATATTTQPAAEIATIGPPKTISDYPWDDGFVGIRENWSAGESGGEVHLLKGPSIFLQLKPRNISSQLSNVETMQIVGKALKPLAAYRSTGWSYVRNRHGSAAFTSSKDDPSTAQTASMLVRNGEIHGVDCYHLQVDRFRGEGHAPYVATGAVEEILIDGLLGFLTVARDYLDLPPSLDVVAGLEDVAGYRLAVDPNYFGLEKFAGHIFHNTIGHTASIDSYEQDPFEILLPLFTKIYDEAGVERPDVRTVGKSQR